MIEIAFHLPLKTISEANCREHWRAKARRHKIQRETCCVRVACSAMPKAPIHVILTRLGKRDLDDDNLSGAFKHCRDGIADAYQIDDGDKSLCTWEYRQLGATDCGIIFLIGTRLCTE